MVRRHADFRAVYHGSVPQCLISYWLANAGSQLICEVETYAFEASRLGLVKRASPSACMFALISFVSLVDLVLPVSAWFDRVASPANPADMPSRGQGSEAGKISMQWI